MYYSSSSRHCRHARHTHNAGIMSIHCVGGRARAVAFAVCAHHHLLWRGGHAHSNEDNDTGGSVNREAHAQSVRQMGASRVYYSKYFRYVQSRRSDRNIIFCTGFWGSVSHKRQRQHDERSALVGWRTSLCRHSQQRCVAVVII